MSDEFEAALVGVLVDCGCEVDSVIGETSKELAVDYKGLKFYISRTTGLKKGELVVVADPSIVKTLDLKVGPLKGVSIRTGRSGRYISSSNYKRYRNKGELDRTNEHFGAAYTLDVSSDLTAVSSFFKV
ncbi:MAG: hypothetical protein JXR18_13185 [Neptuniibacter sp.]